MKNIAIKQAKKEDFKVLAQIYSEEFSKPPYNENWAPEKAVKKLQTFSNYCDIFKIEFNEEIIGFIVLNPNHWCPGEVVFGEEMAIKEEHQNKGIGTKVFDYIFSYYKNKGFKKFMGISNKKSRALNLYKRLGINESEENIVIDKNL